MTAATTTTTTDLNPFPGLIGGLGSGIPPPPGMMEEDIIGAIKIKDGLFIGDEFAA